MNESTFTDDLRVGPVDDLDRLLSGFFKSQMKNPWPLAPDVAQNEPSTLVAARSTVAETPGNTPVLTRDSGSRARLTLAASVALFLGTGWFLTNGFQPGQSGSPGNPTNPVAEMLGGGMAGNPKALETIREDKAKNADPKVTPPKIELP